MVAMADQRLHPLLQGQQFITLAVVVVAQIIIMLPQGRLAD
jgi:hypothetical protein